MVKIKGETIEILCILTFEYKLNLWFASVYVYIHVISTNKYSNMSQTHNQPGYFLC
jgi:hypothetical protein